MGRFAITVVALALTVFAGTCPWKAAAQELEVPEPERDPLKNVVAFKECHRSHAASDGYSESRASLSWTDDAKSAMLDYTFCHIHSSALMHVHSLMIDLTDSDTGTRLVHHPVRLCADNRHDCIAQLKEQHHPSCLHGSKYLPWLHAPRGEFEAKLHLMENGDKVIAHLCPVQLIEIDHEEDMLGLDL